jgi:hypothetical protein
VSFRGSDLVSCSEAYDSYYKQVPLGYSDVHRPDFKKTIPVMSQCVTKIHKRSNEMYMDERHKDLKIEIQIWVH